MSNLLSEAEMNATAELATENEALRARVAALEAKE